MLRSVGILVDPGASIVPGRLLACAYPRREAAWVALAQRRVSLLVNLHERAHEPLRLRRYAVAEVHVPIRDFSAPSPDAIDRAIAAIDAAIARGQIVAVHCGGGLGRTGTIVACYLVSRGLTAEAAIARVRALRPGSVETHAQAAAVAAYERRLRP